jgi:hypothetical protein
MALYCLHLPAIRCLESSRQFKTQRTHDSSELKACSRKHSQLDVERWAFSVLNNQAADRRGEPTAFTKAVRLPDSLARL